jgi:hypothetical protein
MALELLRRGSLGLAGQEALATEDRTPLCWFERDSGLPSALRAGGHGFTLGEASATAAGALTLGLAGLAALGLVFEILIVEKVLLARSEDEIRTAVYTLEDAILKLRHCLYPRST